MAWLHLHCRGARVVEAAAIQGRAAFPFPSFQVDPLWPESRYPNHWIVGAVIGVSVDSNDHIWIIHRQGSLESEKSNTPP